MAGIHFIGPNVLSYNPPAAGTTWVTEDLYVYADPFTGFDGSTITDLSGNGVTITRGNSITTDSEGWVLDATSPSTKYFYFQSPLTSATDFSIEVWFKANTGTSYNGEPNFVADANFATNYDLRFGMKGAGDSNKAFAQTQNQEGSNNSPFLTAGTIIDSNWRQYVLTWPQSGTARYYVNGSEYTTASSVGGTMYQTGTRDMYCMGPINPSFLWGWSNARGGLVRVYTKQLTADEVLQNYDANKADYGLS